MEDEGAPFLVGLPVSVLEDAAPLRDEQHLEERLRTLHSSGQLQDSIVNRLVPREADGSVGVGRLPRLSEVVLDVAEVSRRHAEFRRTGSGAWVVADNASGNGSFLDGQSLPPKVPTPVRSGQVLRFSSYRCLFLEPRHL